MGIKTYLKARSKIKNINPQNKISDDDMKSLFEAVRFESKIKHHLQLLWNFLIGLCTIIAAIFSVLAYLKS